MAVRGRDTHCYPQIPHLPACVGVVLMVEEAAVGVLTSLSLEDDAAASRATLIVEFCGDGAGGVPELPFVIWLMFFWESLMRAMVLGAADVGWAASVLELPCRQKVKTSGYKVRNQSRSVSGIGEIWGITSEMYGFISADMYVSFKLTNKCDCREEGRNVTSQKE